MRACPVCGSAVPIRWRNDPGTRPPVVTHVAGPVQDVVEPRRSCPGYIAHRYQDCTRCGMEIVAGRWAVFFLEGEVVTQLGEAAPIYTSGTYFHPDATPCERPSIPRPREAT